MTKDDAINNMQDIFNLILQKAIFLIPCNRKHDSIHKILIYTTDLSVIAEIHVAKNLIRARHEHLPTFHWKVNLFLGVGLHVINTSGMVQLNQPFRIQESSSLQFEK